MHLGRTTLSKFLIQQLKGIEGASDLGALLVDVAAATKAISAMTAKGALKAVKIDPSLMVAEEREILEDLVVAACADARTRAERVMQERMAEITKGLPIPPGMKLF